MVGHLKVHLAQYRDMPALLRDNMQWDEFLRGMGNAIEPDIADSQANVQAQLDNHEGRIQAVGTLKAEMDGLSAMIAAGPSGHGTSPNKLFPLKETKPETDSGPSDKKKFKVG